MSKNEGVDLTERKDDSLSFGRDTMSRALWQKIRPSKGLYLFLAAIVLASLIAVLMITSQDRVDEMKNSRENPLPIEISEHFQKIEVPAFVTELPQIQAHFAQKLPKTLTPITVHNFVGQRPIPPGVEVRAILLTGATNGLIKAKLSEPLKFDGSSLLDAGVIVLGQGRSSEDRLYIQFDRIVLPGGRVLRVSAQAYDRGDTMLGLRGSRVGDVGLKLAASSGLHFISGMSMGLTSPPAVSPSGQIQRPRASDAVLSGVSTAASEQARNYMEQIKNRPPTIEVKVGAEFLITFDGGANESP